MRTYDKDISLKEQVASAEKTDHWPTVNEGDAKYVVKAVKEEFGIELITKRTRPDHEYLNYYTQVTEEYIRYAHALHTTLIHMEGHTLMNTVVLTPQWVDLYVAMSEKNFERDVLLHHVCNIRDKQLKLSGDLVRTRYGFQQLLLNIKRYKDIVGFFEFLQTLKEEKGCEIYERI